MKKERNCSMYPTYPMPYGNMMAPGMMPGYGQYMPNQGMPSQGMQNMPTSDTNNLASQINSLEKRVSNLEALVGNSNTNSYNTSSFQMM